MYKMYKNSFALQIKFLFIVAPAFQGIRLSQRECMGYFSFFDLRKRLVKKKRWPGNIFRLL